MVNKEPSKELLLLVDIALEKYPYQPLHTLAWIPHIMVGQQEKFDTQTFTTLTELLRTDSRTVRDFLLKEGYLKCIDWVYPTDELTDKGKLAKEKGGHAKYKEWEAEQERKKKIEDFPKKSWYLYEPARIIIGILATGLFSWISYTIGLKNGKSETTKQHPKDTVQYLPKILDKKDTVK